MNTSYTIKNIANIQAKELGIEVRIFEHVPVTWEISRTCEQSEIYIAI